MGRNQQRFFDQERPCTGFDIGWLLESQGDINVLMDTSPVCGLPEALIHWVDLVRMETGLSSDQMALGSDFGV